MKIFVVLRRTAEGAWKEEGRAECHTGLQAVEKVVTAEGDYIPIALGSILSVRPTTVLKIQRNGLPEHDD